MFNTDYRTLNNAQREALVKNLLKVYEDTTAAVWTLLVFQLAGHAYAARVEHLTADMVKLDRESSQNGGATKLRFALSNKQKVALIEAGAEEVGDMATIFAYHKNKGCAVEKWATERYTTDTWVKDSIPYYMQGDIRVNGEEVQVKFENASLTNVNVMQKALEWKLAH